MGKLIDHDHFVFDLDRTLFDTVDKFKNPIWAKQLVPPLTLSEGGDSLTDDVGSVCTLRKGVREMLITLRKHKKIVSFLSVGGVKGYPNKCQPSLQALKTFNILKYFKGGRTLLYKTDKKTEFFKNKADLFVFFDDSQDHLQDVSRSHPDMTLVDTKDLLDFSKIDLFSGEK